MLVRIVSVSPDLWWLQMELARAQRRGRLGRDLTRLYCLYFSPHYASNHYQILLHGALLNSGVFIKPVDASGLAILIDDVLNIDCTIIFHQHWLKEIYRDLLPDRHGYEQIDRYFGHLRLFRALGGKVLWTVHNLFDHDLESDDRKLNLYCLRLIAKLADRILVHGAESIPLVEQACGFEVSHKCSLLHHPLYDSLVPTLPACPPELGGMKLATDLTFLCFGQMRPYKGSGDLLKRYLVALNTGKLVGTKLIFAGLVQDRSLLRQIDNLTSDIRQHVVLINRRVSDAELAWLCQHADAAVLPYRNILTSGSFYQATTHALPTIVPASGMFEFVIEDGVTGLLYANEAELGAALLRAHALGKSKMKKMGQTALKRCQSQSASGLVAERYQRLLENMLLETRVRAE